MLPPLAFASAPNDVACFGFAVDAIRPYFSPTVRSVGTPWRAYRGQLGTQSVVNCSGSYPG